MAHSSEADTDPHRGEDPDAILARHLGLVHRMASAIGRVRPGDLDFDEIVSWGMEGLLDAHRRYRREEHSSFRTYARIRIRGVILDNLRRRDDVPRTVRRLSSILARASAELEHRLARCPTEHEVAKSLEVDLTTLRRMRRHAVYRTISLESLAPGGSGEAVFPDPDADPLGMLLRRERENLVASLLRSLPDKERRTLALYYQRDLTMREVGTVLGVSESRVSQLHARALGRLRSVLGPDKRTDDNQPSV